MSSPQSSSRYRAESRVHHAFATADSLDRCSRPRAENKAVDVLRRECDNDCSQPSGGLNAIVDGFPYRQFSVLVICLAIEPIAFSTVMTYSFSMVEWMRGDAHASFYAGLLTSSYTLAEGTAAMFWGRISDRYGRKPVLLSSLTGLLISTLVMGWTRNYWVALSARALGGFLNGNVALIPTIVSESVKQPKHEAAAFAVPPLSWNFGWICGCILAGFTAVPSQLYPRYFSKLGLFGRLPYLLPSLSTSGLLVISIAIVYLCFEETHPTLSVSPRSTRDLQASFAETSASPVVNHYSDEYNRGIHDKELTPLLGQRRGDAHEPTSKDVQLSQPAKNTLAVVSCAQEIESCQDDGSMTCGKPAVIFNRGVLVWTGAIVFLSFHDMAFTSMLPIYAVDRPQALPGHLDLYGGLGVSLQESGEYGAFCGSVAIVVQLLYLLYAARFGVHNSVVKAVMLCPLTYFVIPFVTLLSQVDMGMFPLLMLKSIVTFLPGPSMIILLKNATSSPMALGRVMGFTMTASGLIKTLAPPVCGIIYSQFGSAATWWSITLIAALGAAELSYAYRTTVERQRESTDEILAEPV